MPSPEKSKFQVEEKKRWSIEDSHKISQTVELSHDKFTMGSCSPEKSNIHIEEKKTSTGETRKISQTIELPRDKFTMVSVGSVLSPGHYWVQSKDEEKDLISVMKIMNEMGKLCKEPLNPKAGDFCLAMFEGFPYRAKVLSVKSDEAEVFFVDFGNVDTCKFSNIGELPLDAWNYRSQAIEIVMADQTPQEFLSLSENAIVVVKPISEEGNRKIVQVEGVKYEKILSPPKVMDDTKKGIEVDSLTSDKGRMGFPLAVWCGSL
ncbi:hypothetical protein J437_LFUL018675 [Ladona fulva]|nr:hypothetical protein J437_LFUL018675 [Ladona fulva]